jgi:hypothetical protein
MLVCGFPTVQVELKAYALMPYFQLLLLLLLLLSVPTTPDNILVRRGTMNTPFRIDSLRLCLRPILAFTTARKRFLCLLNLLFS